MWREYLQAVLDICKIEAMLKYFDNTFFKFLFGFLAILAVSFALLVATQWWGDAQAKASPNDSEFVQKQ